MLNARWLSVGLLVPLVVAACTPGASAPNVEATALAELRATISAPTPTPTLDLQATVEAAVRSALGETPAATPAAASAPTVAPGSTSAPCATGLGGDYSGSVFNETARVAAEIEAEIVQRGCLLNGQFVVHAPLLGSGRLVGQVSGDEVTLLVSSVIDGAPVELEFDGTVGDLGRLQGRYLVPPWPGSITEQVGVWNLSPIGLTAASPTPTPIPRAAAEASVADAVELVREAVVHIQHDEGSGTGVIVDPSGLVLTANHVVEGWWLVDAVLQDGRTLTAVVIGTDADSDLALLRLFGPGLTYPSAALGSSSALRLGDELIALGFPLGFEELTVTRGVMSAIRQSPEQRHVSFVQTDAAINPGNSGGPLINLAGDVVGINSFIIRESLGTNIEGFGFAVASDTAKPIVERLRLGVGLQGIYTSTSFGYSLALPAGWVAYEPDPAWAWMVLPGTDANITVVVDEIASTATLTSFAAAQESSGTEGLDQYTRLSRETVTLRGPVSAVRIREEWRRTDFNVDEKGVEWFFIGDGLGFSVYAESTVSEWLRYGAQMQAVVESTTWPSGVGSASTGATSTEWPLYRDTSLGLSISIPPGWSIETDNLPSVDVVAANNFANVFVRVEEDVGSWTLEDYGDAWHEILTESGGLTYELVRRSNSSLAGLPSFLHEYRWNDSEEFCIQLLEQYVLLHGGSGYLVLGSYCEHSESAYRATVRLALDSLSLD